MAIIGNIPHFQTNPIKSRGILKQPRCNPVTSTRWGPLVLTGFINPLTVVISLITLQKKTSYKSTQLSKGPHQCHYFYLNPTFRSQFNPIKPPFSQCLVVKIPSTFLIVSSYPRSRVTSDPWGVGPTGKPESGASQKDTSCIDARNPHAPHLGKLRWFHHDNEILARKKHGSLNVHIFHITQPLGIWSIMATIRWCPIAFNKWVCLKIVYP